MILKRASQQLLLPYDRSRFWLINLKNIQVEEVEEAKSLLHAEDLTWSSRLVFQKDRSRSMVTYALLRHFLGKFLNCSCGDIKILRDHYGKPFLPKHPLHFNLSHTDDYAFIGIDPNHPIGVDIEKINALEAFPDLLSKFLSSKEEEELRLYYPDLEVEGVIFWSAKEAFLKAIGQGFLSSSLPHLVKTPIPSSAFHLFLVKMEKSCDIYQRASSFEEKVHVYSHVIMDHTLAICTINQDFAKTSARDSLVGYLGKIGSL